MLQTQCDPLPSIRLSGNLDYDFSSYDSVTLYPAHSRVGGGNLVLSLRSPLSAEFWWHCVLSGKTQRRSSNDDQMIYN